MMQQGGVVVSTSQQEGFDSILGPSVWSLHAMSEFVPSGY